MGFSVLELIFGLFTNSVAILSDALHDLGDGVSLGFAWFFARLSTKESDQEYSYGYQRFSTLGALMNSFILLFGAIFIIQEAIPRLISPEPVKAGWMILISIVGIGANFLAVIRMQEGKTLNAKVVSLHLLEDVFGWAAVLLVSIVMLIVDFPILDPILSLVISVWVLVQAIRSLVETAKVFLQAVPGESAIREIEAQLCEIPDVIGIHHTHIWSLDGHSNVFTTHLIVNPQCTRDDICRIKTAVYELTEGFNPEHTTIEIEYEGDDCRLLKK
jgi:cobalt-zinc-cadmium efflux system protein